MIHGAIVVAVVKEQMNGRNDNNDGVVGDAEGNANAKGSMAE